MDIDAYLSGRRAAKSPSERLRHDGAAAARQVADGIGVAIPARFRQRALSGLWDPRPDARRKVVVHLADDRSGVSVLRIGDESIGTHEFRIDAGMRRRMAEADDAANLVVAPGDPGRSPRCEVSLQDVRTALADARAMTARLSEASVAVEAQVVTEGRTLVVKPRFARVSGIRVVGTNGPCDALVALPDEAMRERGWSVDPVVLSEETRSELVPGRPLGLTLRRAGENVGTAFVDRRSLATIAAEPGEAEALARDVVSPRWEVAMTAPTKAAVAVHRSAGPNGRVALWVSPRELDDALRDPVVASFVGSSVRQPVTVADGTRRRVVREGEGEEGLAVFRAENAGSVTTARPLHLDAARAMLLAQGLDQESSARIAALLSTGRERERGRGPESRPAIGTTPPRDASAEVDADRRRAVSALMRAKGQDGRVRVWASPGGGDDDHVEILSRHLGPARVGGGEAGQGTVAPDAMRLDPVRCMEIIRSADGETVRRIAEALAANGERARRSTRLTVDRDGGRDR